MPTKKSDLEHVSQTINALFVLKVKMLCRLFYSSNSSFPQLKKSCSQACGGSGSMANKKQAQRHRSMQGTNGNSVSNSSGDVLTQVEEEKVGGVNTE